MTEALKRDRGFYLFGFADESGVLFEIHANNLTDAQAKLVEILDLAPNDPRRNLPWRNWTPNQPGDPFKYGSFRKIVVGPRTEPDPYIRPVQK